MLAGAAMAEPSVKRPYDSLLQAANAHARSLAAATGAQAVPEPVADQGMPLETGSGQSRSTRTKRKGK